MATVMDMYYQKLFDLMLSGTGSKISVPRGFHERVRKVDTLLENDYTGIVSTIINFMVQAATVDIDFNTGNSNLDKTLKYWKENVNKNVAIDIPSGLRSFTEQYFRERWRSSFIAVKIRGAKIDGYWLPTRMWLLDGGSIYAKNDKGSISSNEYYLGKADSNKTNIITTTDNEITIIRKPYNFWHDLYPTPYLVKKGALYHAIFKSAILQKQAEVINTALPYQMLIKLGCEEAMRKGQMPTETQLKEVEGKFQQIKTDSDEHAFAKGIVGAVPFDVNFEELIPDYKKALDKAITETVDKNLLCALGLVELKGFSSTREEAILNPKVMVQEVEDGVADYLELLGDIMKVVQDKNNPEHKKTSNIDINVRGGVIKAFLTDDVKKLIKNYTDTGILSIRDGFEALPSGFTFDVSKNRRIQEQKDGDEELFFPRVILNQDSNAVSDVPPRPGVTPQEVPQKKQSEKAEEEYIEAPYKNIDELPKQVKVLPEDGQRLWMEVFNDALNQYDNDESIARKVAWTVVKKKYVKNSDGVWTKKENE